MFFKQSRWDIFRLFRRWFKLNVSIALLCFVQRAVMSSTTDDVLPSTYNNNVNNQSNNAVILNDIKDKFNVSGDNAIVVLPLRLCTTDQSILGNDEETPVLHFGRRNMPDDHTFNPQTEFTDRHSRCIPDININDAPRCHVAIMKRGGNDHSRWDDRNRNNNKSLDEVQA